MTTVAPSIPRQAVQPTADGSNFDFPSDSSVVWWRDGASSKAPLKSLIAIPDDGVAFVEWKISDTGELNAGGRHFTPGSNATVDAAFGAYKAAVAKSAETFATIPSNADSGTAMGMVLALPLLSGVGDPQELVNLRDDWRPGQVLAGFNTPTAAGDLMRDYMSEKSGADVSPALTDALQAARSLGKVMKAELPAD